MSAAGEKKITPGYHFGKLTVTSDTGKRKNGYIIWNCVCDCGGSIELDVRTIQRRTVRDCGCETKVKPGQKDITGLRFGKLTALYPASGRGCDGDLIWHCKCDCGGEIDAPLHQLRAGYRKSCGCLWHPPLKKYIGRRFGHLTVLEYAGKRSGLHQWRCLCDCGNETVVGQTNLQSGKTKSCGCLQAETARDNLKLVDGTSVTMLEAVKKHLMSTNTSGYTGVYFDKRTRKWVARITFKRKDYSLGSYDKIEDAVKARKRGEEMHDDFLGWYYSREKESSGENQSSEGRKEGTQCRDSNRKKESALATASVN